MPNAGEVGRQSSGFLREKALRSEEKDSGMKYLFMEDFAGQPVSFVFPRRVDHGDMREQLPYGRVLGPVMWNCATARFVATADMPNWILWPVPRMRPF